MKPSTGPITAQRQRRSALILLCVLALSATLIFSNLSTGTVAVGMGLAFPGAGFWPSVWDDGGALCFGAPAWISYLAAALIAKVSFFVAVAAWFGAGNIIAPLFVWITAAGLASVFAPHTAMFPPIALILAPFGLWAALVIGIRFGGGSAKDLPAPFAAAKPQVDQDIPQDVSEAFDFALNRALQPLDQFEGFQFVDQFQTAATRYQIAQAGYALSLLNARLPAFRGYLAKAQRNLIEKQLDHRIWRYWRLENLWGNFDANPDPVARDNIMYVGFLAAQIAPYEKLTGDKRFSAPDALVLRKPDGSEYRYNQADLIAALYRGWGADRFGLMPCEPNWIYPLCNFIGASAASAHDAGRWAAQAEGFQTHLIREFCRPDNRFVPFRSSLTGLAVPAVGGAVVEAYPLMYLNVVFPDLATRMWAAVRQESLMSGQLRRRKFWKVDTGDYRFSRAVSYAGFAAAAAEMGDPEARDLALAALDRECPAEDENWHRPQASVFAHMTELMARVNPGGGMQTLFTGPVVQDSPYLDTQNPSIRVRRAMWRRDHLDLGLDLPVQDTVDLDIAGLPHSGTLRWSGSDQGTCPITEGRVIIRLPGGKPHDLKLFVGG